MKSQIHNTLDYTTRTKCANTDMEIVIKPTALIKDNLNIIENRKDI